MANTTVIAQLPSGLTPTLSLYAQGSDVLANSGGADVLTEATNAKGQYTATITEALAGTFYAKILVGSAMIASGWVAMMDDTATYYVVDQVPLAAGVALTDAEHQQISHIVRGTDYAFVGHDGDDASSAAAVVSAVDAAAPGTVVKVGPGRFDFSGQTGTIQAAAVSIEGAGVGLTRFFADNEDVFGYVPLLTPSSYSVYRGFSLYNANGVGIGGTLGNITDVMFDRVIATGYADGFRLDFSAGGDVRFRRCVGGTIVGGDAFAFGVEGTAPVFLDFNLCDMIPSGDVQSCFGFNRTGSGTVYLRAALRRCRLDGSRGTSLYSAPSDGMVSCKASNNSDLSGAVVLDFIDSSIISDVYSTDHRPTFLLKGNVTVRLHNTQCDPSDAVLSGAASLEAIDNPGLATDDDLTYAINGIQAIQGTLGDMQEVTDGAQTAAQAAATSSASVDGKLTTARASKLDNLDASVSSRATPADVEQPINLIVTEVAQTSAVSPARIDLVRGDDYNNANGSARHWSAGTWPDLTGATVVFSATSRQTGDVDLGEIPCTVIAGLVVRLELTAAQTQALDLGALAYDFVIVATLADTSTVTLVEGSIDVSDPTT